MTKAESLRLAIRAGTYPEDRITHPRVLDGVLSDLQVAVENDAMNRMARDEERGDLMGAMERPDRWETL